MRILFICRFLPHPNVRDSGNQDKFQYISSLSNAHEVSLISFIREDQESALNAMKLLCKHIETIPFQQNSLLSRLWLEIWRWIRPRVYGRVFSLRYHSQLSRLLKSHSFDVAIVDGTMAAYGLNLTDLVRILDEVDIYSTVAFHLYKNEENLIQRIRLYGDWIRTFQTELRYIAAYDGILVRSVKDQLFLQEYLREKKITVLPPWFEGLSELQAIPIQRPTGNNILFMGAMNIPANIEAVTWFVYNVMPLIHLQLPDTILKIVGSSPAQAVRALGDCSGVYITGEVDDLTPYYTETAVNVVPLFTGGGIIVKTLNGMAAGRPTVATNVGNSGTGALPGRDLLVTDPIPNIFAAEVIRILADEKLWHSLATRGRAFIQQTYEWQTIMDEFENYLHDIIKND